MRKLLLVVLLVCLAVPATAPAKGSGSGHKNAAKSAAKECKVMRTTMGADAFRAAFAGKHGKSAFGRCVSTQRKARKAARKRARKACRADGLRGQAMKRCFRQKLAEDTAPKPADYEDAVKECQEDQADDPEEFAAEFGDGQDGFAKCVAHEAADQAEQGDDSDDEGDDGEDKAVDSTPDDSDESPGDSEPDEL